MDTISDFVKGDTRKYYLTFTREIDGVTTAIDITGYTITLTMKANEMTPGAGNLQVNAVITDAEAGTATITLEHEDTKELVVRQYFYDIQVVDNYGQVSTVLRNKVRVLQDRTDSIPGEEE